MNDSSMEEARQGERNDLNFPPCGGKLSAAERRLGDRQRAIDRVPKIVQLFYTEDLLGVEEAVTLGPKYPSERRKQTIQEIAHELETITIPQSKEERRKLALISDRCDSGII